MDENKLRAEIRKAIISEYFYQKPSLHESYAVNVQPGEFSAVFIEPFKNAVKNAFVELKKIAATALTTLRVAFTLNQNKSELIIARHKDRMKNFEQESKALYDALGGDGAAADYNALKFLASPGTAMAKALAGASLGTIEVAKEIGIGDKAIDVVKGDKTAEQGVMDRREQDGPIKRLIRNLENLFFLESISAAENLLVESVAEDMTSQILAGQMGPMINQAREELAEDLQSYADLVSSIAAQNAFLTVMGRVETAESPEKGLQQMEQALLTLKSQDPESAKEFQALPSMIKSEAEKLAKDKTFIDEIKADDAEVETTDIDRKALQAVMGETFSNSFSDYTQAINDNNSLLESTLLELVPTGEIDEELAAGLESLNRNFMPAVREAEKIMQKKVIV